VDKYSILDCTLRDGGYITNWRFKESTILALTQGLQQAGLDYVECGYIAPSETGTGRSIFPDIETVGKYLPVRRDSTLYMAMMDCAQIRAEQVTPYTGKSVEGIRVVFYKHQIEEAMALCDSVRKNGYKLFVQPMVTIDYSLEEYGRLIERINGLHPYAVSIVDSFGYMDKRDCRTYFRLLDEQLETGAAIGFHSHNNMQLAYVTAQDVLEYETDRKIIIDASLYGMGRGAGNLNTELIAGHYNATIRKKYDLSKIMSLISAEIMPIAREYTWGYSPYLYLTGFYHCHPNFACFLLEKHDVTVEEFEAFVKFIPAERKTKCRKPYVEELYQEFRRRRYGKKEYLE